MSVSPTSPPNRIRTPLSPNTNNGLVRSPIIRAAVAGEAVAFPLTTATSTASISLPPPAIQMSIPTADRYHPSDVLLELPDVLVQAFPIRAVQGGGGANGADVVGSDNNLPSRWRSFFGGASLPHFSATPQTSPFVVASALRTESDGSSSSASTFDLADVSPTSPINGQVTKGLLLVSNFKIPLDATSTVVQLSRYVYDFHVDVKITRQQLRFPSPNRRGRSSSPASSPAHRPQSPTGRSAAAATPSSPSSSHLYATICVRVALPSSIPQDEADALPSIIECFAPVRRVAGAQRSTERESLLGGGIGLSYAGVGGSASAGALIHISGGQEEPIDPNNNSSNAGALINLPPTVFELPSRSSLTSTAIASNVSYYGRLASGYINTGTSYAVNAMGRGADRVVSTTQGCETPVAVPEAVKNGIEGGRAVAQTAASVTGGVASALLGAAGYVGTYAGGAVLRAFSGDGTDASTSGQLSSYLTAGGESSIFSTTLAPAAEIGSAVIGTGALVFSTVCDAQQSMLEAARNNVAKVVTHKLGPEVGQAAHGVMETARLGVEVACVASNRRVKRTALLMAAKVAKQAADGAVDGRRRLEQEQLTLALRPGAGGAPLAIADQAGNTNSPLHRPRSASPTTSPRNGITTSSSPMSPNPMGLNEEIAFPSAGDVTSAAKDAVRRVEEIASDNSANGLQSQWSQPSPLEIIREDDAGAVTSSPTSSDGSAPTSTGPMPASRL